MEKQFIGEEGVIELHRAGQIGWVEYASRQDQDMLDKFEKYLADNNLEKNEDNALAFIKWMEDNFTSNGRSEVRM